MYLVEEQGYILVLLQMNEPIPDKSRKTVLDRGWVHSLEVTLIYTLRFNFLHCFHLNTQRLPCFGTLKDISVILLKGNVTEDEFKTLKTAAMEKYFVDMKKTHPRHRDRYSEQTWLSQGRKGDKMMKKLRER